MSYGTGNLHEAFSKTFGGKRVFDLPVEMGWRQMPLR